MRFREEAKPRGMFILEAHNPIADGDSSLLIGEQWEDVEFEVALDSGSQDHVCDEEDCPGYSTVASPGSSRGQCFIVGDGNRLPNMGQSTQPAAIEWQHGRPSVLLSDSPSNTTVDECWQDLR